MDESWSFDGNFSAVSGDFFDCTMKYVDFPMEDVEPKDLGGDCEAKSQHHELRPATVSNNVSSCCVSESSCENLKAVGGAPIMRRGYSKHILHPKSVKASSASPRLIYHPVKLSQTCSPVSVLKGSGSCNSCLQEFSILRYLKLFVPIKRCRSKHRRRQRQTFPLFMTSGAFENLHSSGTSESELHCEEKLKYSTEEKRKKIQNMMQPSSNEQRKKPGAQNTIETKKCAHCEATDTPQWREGPKGPKTLCNACGLRYYKSGGLLPEYCPAASATFVQPVRSNSHKTVQNLIPLSSNEERKKPMAPNPSGTRKCGHFEVRDTPERRGRPERAKTLRHACGVCHNKSGRLVPEYHPAADSTFVQPVHSTSQKKKQNVMPSSTNEERKKPTAPNPLGIKKCSHCEATDTPQWRRGPDGAKTLCNACGVRYRSGRLVPEYRPAASPTFVQSIHSNSHNTILAMRNKTTDVTPI